MRKLATLLLLLVSCSEKKADPFGETDAYRDWKPKNFVLAQVFTGGGKQEATITLDPGRLAKNPMDWTEITFNGTTVARTHIFAKPEARPVRVTWPIKLRDGPNWIRLWSTPHDKGFSFEVTWREGTDFTFTPTKDEWVMDQRPR